MPSYRCTVNEVGPAIDGTETASPVVYINLTDAKGSFAKTWFYAADGAQDQMLDVAIAAISGDNSVDVVATQPNAGASPYTAIARIHEVKTLPPAAPTNLHVIELQPAPNPGQRHLLVGWNDNSDKEDGFRLVFRQLPNGAPGEYNVQSNSTTGYMVLDGGHEYTIHVTAFNKAGYSAPSNSILVTVPSTPPTAALLAAVVPYSASFAVSITGTNFGSNEPVDPRHWVVCGWGASNNTKASDRELRRYLQRDVYRENSRRGLSYIGAVRAAAATKDLSDHSYGSDKP